jgi:hypothetical protein
MPSAAARTLKGALAGTVAAGVWAAQMPLDKRAFASRYDDVELLGKIVTRGSGWMPAGVALHLQNGAVFGALYANVAPLLPIPALTRGVALAMAENFASWPLGHVSDRLHPARRELPKLGGNRRALAQATWRHFLFGLVLGELERRLNAEPEIDFPGSEGVASSNGHGNIEQATAARTP